MGYNGDSPMDCGYWTIDGFSAKEKIVVEKPVNPKYRLLIAEGEYTSGSLLGLLMAVLKHRWWHWRRGDGWVD